MSMVQHTPTTRYLPTTIAPSALQQQPPSDATAIDAVMFNPYLPPMSSTSATTTTTTTTPSPLSGLAQNLSRIVSRITNDGGGGGNGNHQAPTDNNAHNA